MNDAPKTSSEKNWSRLIIGIAVVVVAFGLFWKSGPSLQQAMDKGDIVQDFTLPDVNGQAVKLKEYVKGRPMVISFGTTTCPYCELQTKAFKQLQAKLGDQVAFLEVNVGEPQEEVAVHVSRTNRTITTLVDEDGSVYARYGSDAVPVTVIADRSGRILEIGNYISAEQITDILQPKQATQ